MKAYKKMLYGGDLEEEGTSTLYSGVTQAFKFSSLPPAIRDTQVHTDPFDSSILKPKVDLLTKFKMMVPQESTSITPPEEFKFRTEVHKLPSVKVTTKLQPQGFNADKFTTLTYKQESGGDYKAQSKVSSAVGKYQFLWGSWGKDIERVTGVNSKEGFKNNPKAQEKFYQFYLNKHIIPNVKKLAKTGEKFGLTPTEVGRVIHFQGAEGAEKAFAGGMKALNIATKINPSIMAYLGKTKKG